MYNIELRNIPRLMKEIFQDLYKLTGNDVFKMLAELADEMPASAQDIKQILNTIVTADDEVQRQLEIARSLLKKYFYALGRKILIEAVLSNEDGD